MSGASTKPQVAGSVLAEEGMREALEGKLVVPICSGITIAQVRAYLAETTTVVRAMPNVASKVCLKSICGLWGKPSQVCSDLVSSPLPCWTVSGTVPWTLPACT